MSIILRRALGSASAVVWLAGVAAGQHLRADLAGQVIDATGSALPGVTVTIESPALARPAVAVTGADGAYLFSGTPAGTYRMTFSLPGFTPVVREAVSVGAGARADVRVTLELAGLRQTVVVSSFDRTTLEKIPSARDPWVVINMTPGVVMDGVNVGGSASGQQLTFGARGEGAGNATWTLEGATITDMAAVGASPMYFDFDALQELRVSTGAADASQQTGGVQIALVTRRGSNQRTGSVRALASGRAFESNNVTRDLFLIGVGPGTPLKRTFDYGGEIGGPIVRNRAWFWGAIGVQDLTTSTAGFYRPTAACTPPPGRYEDLDRAKDCLYPDRAVLTTGHAKLNYTASAAHRFQLFTAFNRKTRNARGASETTRPDATFRQHGTVPIVQIRHGWNAGGRLAVESFVQRTGGGFALDFQRPALAAVQPSIDLATGVRDRSLTAQYFDRPATEVRTDATWLVPRLAGGDHALRFGFGWRRNVSESASRTGGDAVARFVGTTASSADLTRDGLIRTRLDTTSAYVQDEMAIGRLHLGAGVRVDRQDDRALAAAVTANPIVPDYLPAVTFDGANPPVDFLDVAPRLSAAYDVLGRGRTVARASYAVYHNQGVGLAGSLSAATSATTSRTAWVDTNGDRAVQRSELNLAGLPFCALPEGCVVLPIIDPALLNARTRETVIGIDHEVMLHVTIGASYIRRHYDRYRLAARDGETSAIYVARTWTDPASGRTGTYYEIAPGASRPPNVARVATNPTRSLDYHGLEIAARKGLGDGWMAAVAVTLNGTTDHRPPGSYIDPTNIDKIDGRPGGAFSTRYVLKATGFAALPGAFNASAAVNVQDGFDRPIVFDGPPARNGLGFTTLLDLPAGTTRYPALTMVDLQIDRPVRIAGGRARVDLSVVVFNLFNVNTIRAQSNNLSQLSFGRVTAIVAPRVVRVGGRVVF